MPTQTEPRTLSISDYINLFSLTGQDNILAEEHFGIVNGHITTNVLHSKVLSFRTLFAPPYASSNFMFEGRAFGELVKTQAYSWAPQEVHREGDVQGVKVASTLTLIEGQRALGLEITLENTTRDRARVPLLFSITGGMDYITAWEFQRPKAEKPVWTQDKGDLLIRRNDTGGIAVAAAGAKMKWEEFSSHWKTTVTLKSGQTRTLHLLLAMGEADAAEQVARDLLKNPSAALQRSRTAWTKRAGEMLQRLPRFSAADTRLERFYYRSAVHLLLNRWEVPEFILHPFYSTGSVNGGCVSGYLWDFGEGWEILPLVDPAALREHVKAFLNINLTRHFAFNPLGGAGWGPWYYINQEKIVFLIYHYVLLSGDTRFLQERVNGQRILDWVVHHAMHGDERKKQANLIDYGAGNHHLELRREYRYDHYLPDMNMRRYAVYEAADALCKLADEQPLDFRDRAEKLKRLIKKEMWSGKDKWWYFLNNKGCKELRYTMQMFKLIGSGVLDKHQQEALIGHINQREFLSEFGMHSMSKLDPAYDQVDIDNGGGGAYCSFPPQIIERLYKTGHADKAEDILGRILWWGDRLPYWSDSFVANAMDYRRDTPLQNTIGAVAGAQAIIFGMFGIQVTAQGRISVNPAPPSFSQEIALKGMRVCGTEFNVQVGGGTYEISVHGRTIKNRLGRPTVFQASGQISSSSA
jgi:hypothetical protein